MANAVLLPGTGGSAAHYWFPYARRLLESSGYQVDAPTLPHVDRPTLADSLAEVFATCEFTDATIVIAHSSACPLVLSILERLDVTIEQAICVAGFYQPIAANADSRLMLQDSYAWDRIKRNARGIVFINSDNDPWGCDDRQVRDVAVRLDATLVVPVGEGHFGSDSFDQPYTDFPLLARLLNRT